MGGVGGGNSAPAVNQTMRLIEVHGLGHIAGDDGIVLPGFGNAFHLNGQEHGDAISLQFAGEHDGRRPAPTLTKKNNAGALLFFRGKDAVVIRIQEPQNGLVGGSATAVLKDLDVRVGGRGVLKALGELHRTVAWIVVANKASNEANHDGGRSGVAVVQRGAFRLSASRGGYGQGCQGGSQETELSDNAQATSSSKSDDPYPEEDVQNLRALSPKDRARL